MDYITKDEMSFPHNLLTAETHYVSLNCVDDCLDFGIQEKGPVRNENGSKDEFLFGFPYDILSIPDEPYCVENNNIYVSKPADSMDLAKLIYYACSLSSTRYMST
ncbi:hypothetical protein JXC34_05855, partial [Candidatus Woesearchaeota archaeon]|nr:hypothetical protein [Candidatus Woesearchaeota archaeon]